MAAVRKPGRVAIAGVQGGFELADLVATELLHPRAERSQARAFRRGPLETPRRGVHHERARVAHVLRRGRPVGQPLVGAEGVLEEGGERAGVAHPGRLGRVGGESHEPRDEPGQVAPADRERRIEVQQHPRHRREHRHGGERQRVVQAAEHAEVAEGGALARLSPIDHADLEAGALQETGAAHPDDARPDDSDAARAGHRFNTGARGRRGAGARLRVAGGGSCPRPGRRRNGPGYRSRRAA